PASGLAAVDFSTPIASAEGMSLITKGSVFTTTQRFNGSFMKLNAFRQPDGPEVDAAWNSLGTDYRAFVVSPSDGPRSGLTPKTHVHISPRYGVGYPCTA
ncbi:hypothetical protein GMDG_02844, partial [Pseudogymnoascus destructans 20631-21]